MTTFTIIDCNDRAIEFESFCSEQKVFYKTTKPISITNLKLPLLYLLKEVSDITNIVIKTLTIKIVKISCDLIDIVVTNGSSFTHSKEFSYEDTMSILFNSTSDDPWTTTEECTNRYWDVDSDFIIKDVILIYYNGEFIITEGSTQVSGPWFHVILFYKCLTYLLFMSIKVSIFILLSAGLLYLLLFGMRFKHNQITFKFMIIYFKNCIINIWNWTRIQ